MYEPADIEYMKALVEQARKELPTLFVADDFPYSVEIDFPARIVRSPFVPPGVFWSIPGELS